MTAAALSWRAHFRTSGERCLRPVTVQRGWAGREPVLGELVARPE